MRMKVGIVATSLVVSVLSFSSAGADDTTTSEATSTSSTDVTTSSDETTSTSDATTTTAESTTTDAPTTTADEPTTTVDCAPPTTTDDAATTTDESTTTTTIAGCAPPTTTDDTPSTVDLSAPAPPTSTGLGSVGPASPGQGPPIRGTQVATRPIPPKPTTTTTTTTVPPPSWGLPSNSGSGRRVVYSKSRQRVWAIDSNGVVIKTHLVSGRQTPRDPSPGNYRVWSRSRYTHSINNPSITWGYMVRFAWGARGGNIGLHEIPFQYGRPVQSVSQLGQPLSGGCVRQAKPDAIWMWNWAQLGTRVVVLG